MTPRFICVTIDSSAGNNQSREVVQMLTGWPETKNASLIEAGETVVGVGTVTRVDALSDSRWSVRVTWEDGSSTLYPHHVRVQTKR